MRIRRVVRSASTFVSQFVGAFLKAVVISVVLGVILVSVMHRMGVPVPRAYDLIGGFSKWARIGS